MELLNVDLGVDSDNNLHQFVHMACHIDLPLFIIFRFDYQEYCGH